MWIVLSINNSRYKSWQVSVLIWSIELSISYVSLRSDNITNVKISYVLANLFESLKTTTFLQVIVPTLVSLAIATQTLSQMRNSNWLWNLKLFQVTCQLNYTWNSVINQVEFWRLCKFQVRNTKSGRSLHAQPVRKRKLWHLEKQSRQELSKNTEI